MQSGRYDLITGQFITGEKCPKCEQPMLYAENIWLTSNPPQQPYRCTTCGHNERRWVNTGEFYVTVENC